MPVYLLSRHKVRYQSFQQPPCHATLTDRSSRSPHINLTTPTAHETQQSITYLVLHFDERHIGLHEVGPHAHHLVQQMPPADVEGVAVALGGQVAVTNRQRDARHVTHLLQKTRELVCRGRGWNLRNLRDVTRE